MIASDVFDWLLQGDVAIQYQVHRDLLGIAAGQVGLLQERIAREGWGAAYLALRRPDGHWGLDFYQPKWTSTHYTLLDLKLLGFPHAHPLVRESVAMVLREPEGTEGGINYSRNRGLSDVCINGMVLHFAAWFMPESPRLPALVDYLLDRQMADGGWNCAYFKGHTHSSLHSTLSVLEGLHEFTLSGNPYRAPEIRTARAEALEFLLLHRLFRSHRTGEVIDPRMLRFSFPPRWRFDILRALDHFQAAGIPYDPRMQDALDILLKKCDQTQRWPLQAKHPGQVHFDMEKTGMPSRWNTLRALRVLKHFDLRAPAKTVS